MKIGKITDTFFYQSIEKGKEIKVSAHRRNSLLQTHFAWEKIKENDILDVRAEIRGIDHGNSINSKEFGFMETWSLIEKKEFDMTPEQFFNLVKAFKEEGHVYYDKI